MDKGKVPQCPETGTKFSFYSDIKTDYFQELVVLDPRGIDGVPPNPLVQALYSDFDQRPGVLLNTIEDIGTEQIALFGELGYQFSDKLTANVGLRWFEATQEFSQSVGGRLNGSATQFSREFTENGVNPKFQVDYEASDDVTVYGQVSRGFRLGGAQLFVPTIATPTLDCPSDLAQLNVDFDPNGFDSENAWNYELGVKSTFMDGTVQLNLSAFFIDYSDLQITTRLPCGFSFTDNAESAESKGFELELKAQLSEALDIGISGSYVRRQIK